MLASLGDNSRVSAWHEQILRQTQTVRIWSPDSYAFTLACREHAGIVEAVGTEEVGTEDIGTEEVGAGVASSGAAGLTAAGAEAVEVAGTILLMVSMPESPTHSFCSETVRPGYGAWMTVSFPA